jgi:hypothetical protein
MAVLASVGVWWGLGEKIPWLPDYLADTNFKIPYHARFRIRS